MSTFWAGTEPFLHLRSVEPPVSRFSRPCLAAAAVLVLASCSAGDADGGGAASTASADSGYPIEVENCGTQVTFTQAPERIVTVKSSTTELVLALGLQDRLVGTAFLDGPFPPELAEAGAAVPVLADRAPSSEVVLAAEPDLIYAGWESSFEADALGTRAELADLGVLTYVSPPACQSEGQPDPLTFEHVFAAIAEAGALLGVPAEGERLAQEQRDALAQLEPSDQAQTALWYSSGTDTPYVGGGIGAPQIILEAAGLENVAADLDASWGSIGWESVAAAEPEVIVLVDATWNTAESKIELLESNPVTATLPAVIDGRYLIVPFAATEAGIRNVEAAASLIEQLEALG